ncbi:hypothetical protein BGX31_010688 [Mortierella sp. GBA43]|nr:hypothetical protein BGX31_010688 [Mortierella sp. GBA43]
MEMTDDANAGPPLNLIPAEALPYIPPPLDLPPDQWGNRIPDFSQVGYRGGHVPLPKVPVKIVLRPSADPRINDRARIQEAIDWVGRQPLEELKLRDGKTVIRSRGAVLLQAGIYRVQGALILNKSGVVLRGEGNGPNGTVVMAMGQFKHDFIYLNGVLDSGFQGTPQYLERYGTSKGMYPKNPYVIQDRYVARVADEYVPVGTTRLPMTDISNFKVGAQVVVETQPYDNWVHRLGMDNIPPRPDDPDRTLNWDQRQYKLRYVRRIVGIEKKQRIGSISLLKDDQRGSRSRDRQRPDRRHRPRALSTETKPFAADANQTSHVRPLEAMDSVERLARDDKDHDDRQPDSDNSRDGGFKSQASRVLVPGYVTLDIPTVMNMEPQYGEFYVYNFDRELPIPSDVGVENMALWSEFDADNVEDEQHAWYAVLIDHCENCWAADIKATNFVSGVKAGPGSKHVTVQDCEILDPISLRNEGGRRYMYMLQGQMGLVKRCYATNARHDFMTGAKTPGPNVFVDSDGFRANNDAGPHDRWTTGTLYDNIHSHDFNIRNRGWMGSGQGWAGAFHVSYRCSADVPVEFQSPPGATNWVIGFAGKLGRKSIEFEGDDATFLEPEPQDIPHVPRSLYWSQLVARMGDSNSAAESVEKNVGVAGKNTYPPPVPRSYASGKDIMSGGTMGGTKTKGHKGGIRLELGQGGVLDILREIERLDEGLLGGGNHHSIHG